MKAQAALVESVVGILLLMTFATAFARISYTLTQSQNQVKYADAYYDFVEMYCLNNTFSNCINNSSYQCAMSMVKNFSLDYGLEYLALKGSFNATYGGDEDCINYYRGCFVTRSLGVECIYMCG